MVLVFNRLKKDKSSSELAEMPFKLIDMNGVPAGSFYYIQCGVNNNIF